MNKAGSITRLAEMARRRRGGRGDDATRSSKPRLRSLWVVGLPRRLAPPRNDIGYEQALRRHCGERRGEAIRVFGSLLPSMWWSGLRRLASSGNDAVDLTGRRPWLASLVAGLLMAAAPAWSVTVKDDRGARVHLDAPAERVVSLAPFITELVYAAGAGDKLVAVSKHSDYPAGARDLPRIGDAFTVKLEALLALRPDVVVSWKSGNDPRVDERLRSMGIPVFVLEPRALDDVPRALRGLGRLLGTDRHADEQARAFSEAVERIRREYATRDTVRVFYQVSREPLMTLNGRHMVTALLHLCGGVNVFHDLSPIAPTVNREQVLASDPDAILIGSGGGPAPDRIDYWSRYPSLTAVRLGNVFSVDSDLINRQTPRLVEGARQICRSLERARAGLAAGGR